MALIKCSECGHDVSDKATSCPYCGNPIKKDVPLVNNDKAQNYELSSSNESEDNNTIIKWCVGIVLTICMIFGIFYSITNTVNRKSKQKTTQTVKVKTRPQYTKLVKTNAQEVKSVEDKAEGKLTKIGNWYYSAKKDPMTGEKIYLAINMSTNKNKVCGEITDLHIYLTYNSIGFIGLGIRKGSFRTERLPMAYVRFDDGDIEQFGTYVDTEHNVYLYGDRNFNNFVKALIASKKVAIKIETGDFRTATYTFNTGGLCWTHFEKENTIQRKTKEAIDADSLFY